MKNRNIAVINLRNCKYLGEIHKQIKTALNFSEYYGENQDAFWDCLSFDTSADYILIYGESTLPIDLKEHLKKMHEILQRCKEERAEYGHKFDFFIMD